MENKQQQGNIHFVKAVLLLALLYFLAFTPKGKKHVEDFSNDPVEWITDRVNAVAQSINDEELTTSARPGWMESKSHTFFNDTHVLCTYTVAKKGDTSAMFIAIPHGTETIHARIERGMVTLENSVKSLTSKESQEEVKRALDNLYKKLRETSSAVFYCQTRLFLVYFARSHPYSPALLFNGTVKKCIPR